MFHEKLESDRYLLIIIMKGTSPLLFISSAKPTTNIDVLIDYMTVIYEEIFI